MSEMPKHADEPWHVEEIRGGWELCHSGDDGEAGHVALFPDMGEHDARRAAECVNACAGMTPLEPGLVRELTLDLDEARRAVGDLLAALRRYGSQIDDLF